MKRVLAAMLGVMAIGATTTTTAAFAASDLPKWEASVFNFTNTLRPGMNLVELRDSGRSVVVEKDGGTLFAWATSGEQRRALPDGTYAFMRVGINECDVRAGVVEACR